MFGFVTANWKELTQEQKDRYSGVYCGICREIKARASQTARLTLSYDMAFLALLLMSLYEPEEASGRNRCVMHPVHRRLWIDNEFVRYGADMNVALAYYNCLDDWHDDGKPGAKLLAKALEGHCEDIRRRYPRQCEAISDCISRLSRLEKENCPNPDEPAGCFGRLMAELLVYKEDIWAPHLRQMGMALGRYIYLADAAVDYRSDRRKKKYNPFLAMGSGEDWARWEEYLVLAMGRCTRSYEMLPLVQDKALLDNILYSGIWVTYRNKGAKAREET
ncbi:MAG: hypothetical protein J6B95_02030 [Oscillospiraceae bacterium]|nr:hypothetical protein [Oscillospiraceae bacterium]